MALPHFDSVGISVWLKELELKLELFLVYLQRPRMNSSKVQTLLRQIFRVSPVRSYSSALTATKDLVLLDVNEKTGFATVTLNSPPVNSLSLELLRALNTSLDVLKKDNPRGMILTSVKYFNFRANKC